MGSTGGASGLDIWPGYATTGSATPSLSGDGSYSLTCAAGQRNSYSVTTVITGLAPGTYDFGGALSVTDITQWNSNEYGYVSALLID